MVNYPLIATSKLSCVNVQLSEIDQSCNNLNSNIMNSIIPCIGKYTCTFSVDNSIFNLMDQRCVQKLQQNSVYFIVSCQSMTLD